MCKWKSLCFYFIVSVVIYSCKKKSVDYSQFISENAGPSSCLATVSKSLLNINTQTISNKNIFHYLNIEFINSIKQSKNGNFDIVGGTVVNDLSVPAGNNAVAIVLPLNSTDSTLCTGTLVSNSLILTAGHCFNDVDKTSTKPGYVVFDNQISTTSNLASITCWQRNANFCSGDFMKCVLNDIAWIKIDEDAVSHFKYSPASILKNPETAISLTEKKIMAGFGYLGDDGFPKNIGYKKYIVTVPKGGALGDVVPTNGVLAFNQMTSQNAYEKYLTVIGPYSDSSSGYGTCDGDSGGPVYVIRGKSYALAAITQGANYLLSPQPIGGSYPNYVFDTSTATNCDSGYGVYTTVGNYLDWIQNTSGITLNTI